MTTTINTATILNGRTFGSDVTAPATIDMMLGCGVSDAAVKACKGRKDALVTGIRASRFVQRAGALEGVAMVFVEVRGKLERFDVRVECFDGGAAGVWYACGRVSDGGPFGGRFV